MENAPFFVGAVIVGNMAGLSACKSFISSSFKYDTNGVVATMNAVTGVYVALRVAYTALYINTTTQKTSYLRSLTWGASVLVLMGTYIQAGRRWAAGN
jgi:uncharacterized MAPEG superfamily protein